MPADTYTVTATNTEVSASTPPATAPLNLVNSPRLQYQKAGAWLELPDVLYLQRGSNLIFRALPAQNPTVAFPAGKPTWSAAGTGATVTAGNPIDTATAHFTTTSTSATDFKTVSADGIGANVRTAKIIVFTIAITRGANAADISEPQANPQSVMVGAKIDLKAIITPTALQGALTSKQWGLGSGDVVKGYNLDAALPANPTDPPTQKTLLAETDLVNDTVAYYYTNGDFAGQSVTVNFSGKINDVTVAATVKFKVFRPRIVTVTENGAQVSSFIGNFSTDVEGNDPYSA